MDMLTIEVLAAPCIPDTTSPSITDLLNDLYRCYKDFSVTTVSSGPGCIINTVYLLQAYREEKMPYVGVQFSGISQYTVQPRTGESVSGFLTRLQGTFMDEALKLPKELMQLIGIAPIVFISASE
jgi:hypothetical protein